MLLKNYYGTGHFSFDNYLASVSGQATQPDTQSDCPIYKHFAGHVDTSGSLKTNPNYGQMTSAQGPNGTIGANGCVYPASVPTLFKQLDAAKVSWKGYAQDLGYPDRDARRRMTPACVIAALRTRPRSRRQHGAGRTRRSRTRPISTCPSTSRFRGLNRS